MGQLEIRHNNELHMNYHYKEDQIFFHIREAKDLNG